MDARPVSHPSVETLKAFGLGKMDDASAEALMNHLDICPDCCKEVAALSGDDFLARFRQAHGRSITPAPAGSLSERALRPKSPPTTSASPPPIPNLPPELVDNPDYEVLRELGRGGMGVVYLARNKLMDRLEVLKVVNKALLDRPGAIERFLREIRSAAKLNHANVVAAYSALQRGDLLAFAMEYVEGEDLAKVVKSRGPLPVPFACYYTQQAALGLQHAFEKGMVHRDIKPQNLMLSRTSKKHVVKVLDFGLAKARTEKGVELELTGAGMMLGTPTYMAPEQMSDAASADIRADVYSLGCTLYYLLTGAPPFEGNNLYQLLYAHQSVQARPLNLVRSEVPPELAAVVAKMMAKDPAQRYQTPVEVAQALIPFIKQRAKEPPTSPPEPWQGASHPETGSVGGAKSTPSVSGQPFAADTLGEGGITASASRQSEAICKPESPAVKPVPRKKWLIGTVVGTGVLLLILAALWAGGVFKVKTKDGTIVLENLPADAEVLVDGEKVTVTWGDDGKSAEISVQPGTRRIMATKDGVKVIGEEIQIEEGGRKLMTARLGPLAQAPPPDDANPLQNESGGFLSLFNGKDLTGWRSLSASKARWEVKDGVLVGSGGLGYLFNDGNTYENFHLRAEAMINDGGNSGVYFRAPFGPTTPQGHPATGFEAQINISHQDPHKTGSLFVDHRIVHGLPSTSTELDKWFTLEVRANGPLIVVKVNGQVTANYVYLGTGSRSGRIVLQVLDATTVVKFRKIEIKELPPGDLRLAWRHSRGAFEQVKGNVWAERHGNWVGFFRAHIRDNVRDGGLIGLNRKIENNKTGFMHLTRGNGAWWNVEGTTRWTRVFMGNYAVLPRTPPPERSPVARVGDWVPLLNGKDLSGWETTGKGDVTWTYEADALVGRSSAGPAGLLVSHRADYENFHLRMETMLSEGTYSALLLRCGPPNDGAVGNKSYAIAIGNSDGVAPFTGTLALSAYLDEGVVAPLVLAGAARTAVKPGAWFPLEVIAEGRRLRVLVEGKIVVDHTDTNETFTVGRLGLVCRGKAVTHFRKLEIKELPPTKFRESK